MVYDVNIAGVYLEISKNWIRYFSICKMWENSYKI